MAEVGLVRFAHVAHEVAEAVLPSYRNKYSKHLLTQPALLAILCLMRNEDWTFCEAEVRLGAQESAQIALSHCKVHASRWGIAAEWFNRHDIHVHLDEIAYPKQGPSAGWRWRLLWHQQSFNIHSPQSSPPLERSARTGGSID